VDEADRMTIDARTEWLEHVERRAYGIVCEFDNIVSIYFILEKRTRPHSMCWSALIASNRSPLQKILVSATLSKDVERLHQWNLFQPILFRANANVECVQIDKDSSIQAMDEIDGALYLPTDLRQTYAVCASNRKPLILHRLLHEHNDDWRRVICFSSSKYVLPVCYLI
jgi:superfamily II DNA/RNA helicase